MSEQFVAIYARVSTSMQVESGLGLEDQRARCVAYAAAMYPGLEVRIFEDAGESGGNTDRPALTSLLKEVRSRRVRAVIVLKLDRLTRSLRDMLRIIESLERGKATFHSVTESLSTNGETGRLMISLLAAFAEFERTQISARTSAAARQKMRRGESYGYTPYGFTQDGDKLLPNPQEQEVIAIIITLRDSGRSLDKIAQELTAKGIPTKKGGKWRACTVSSILSSWSRSQ